MLTVFQPDLSWLDSFTHKFKPIDNRLSLALSYRQQRALMLFNLANQEFKKSLELLELLTEHGFGMVNLHGINPKTGKCTCRNKACDIQGKHPYAGGWQKKLIFGRADIMSLLKLSIEKLDKDEMFGSNTHHIRSNIGLACGLESKLSPGKYLVIIDIDNNDEMIRRLDACEEQTVNYFTGSGGKHYMYLSDKPFKNSVSTLARGVDVRGLGGYAIIPPSRNAKGNYGRFGSSMIIRELPEFVRIELDSMVLSANRKKSSKPADASTAPKTSKKNTPEEIEKRLASKDGVRKLIDEKTTVIPCGMRNQTLYTYLCQQRARGALKGNLYELAREMIAMRFESPETFSEHELKTLISSVMKFKPSMKTYDEMLRVFFEWCLKNNHIPEQYGNRIFDFQKDNEKLDKEFFSTVLPEAIFENLRVNGRGFVAKELIELRRTYYANLGFNEFQYARLNIMQIGMILHQNYSHIKMIDKRRAGVRRHEWLVVEDKYQEYLDKKAKTHHSLIGVATSPFSTPPLSSPNYQKKKELLEEHTLESFTSKDLSEGIKCRNTRGHGGSAGLDGVCSDNVPVTAPALQGSLANDLTRSSTGVRVQSVTNEHQPETKERHSKNHVNLHFFEEPQPVPHSSEQLDGSPGPSPSCCGSWWFCAVEHGREALFALRQATDGSCFAATGCRACLQCADHEARGKRKDLGKLSNGNHHGIPHPVDELWSSREADSRVDRSNCEGSFGSCDRERGLCRCGGWVRQDGHRGLCSWIGQPFDHPGRRYHPIFSSS